MSITEKQNNRLAEQVYWVDKQKKGVEYRPEKGEIYYYNSKEEQLGQFQVLKTEDNTSNGIQAMAVAPLVDGQPDTSRIVIAYAGTNSGDIKDRQTSRIRVRPLVRLYQVFHYLI